MSITPNAVTVHKERERGRSCTRSLFYSFLARDSIKRSFFPNVKYFRQIIIQNSPVRIPCDFPRMRFVKWQRILTPTDFGICNVSQAESEECQEHCVTSTTLFSIGCITMLLRTKIKAANSCGWRWPYRRASGIKVLITFMGLSFNLCIKPTNQFICQVSLDLFNAQFCMGKWIFFLLKKHHLFLVFNFCLRLIQ